MKKNVFIAALLLSAFTSIAQDAKDLLKKSFAKCQSVQNGYYEMTKYMKYMSGKDTTKNSFNCYFKKLEDDSLYPSAFHYTSIHGDGSSGELMYTGDAFVRISSRDSSAEIMSKSKWAKEIKAYSHNYTFYAPFTSSKSTPLPHDTDLTDNKHFFKFIGEENLKGVSCYHLQVSELPENDSKEQMKELRIEYHYWIKKEDFVPVKYTRAIDMLMNKDTMYQYEIFVLNKYALNNLKDEHTLTLNAIPSFYRKKDFVPYKRPNLLPKDTTPPGWDLLSLTDEKISLKDLKGQLVLIDFFYKSCYPCMQALPALQELHEKYKDKGLKIMGIDPYDNKEDDMAAFLGKRGVTYTVLLGGKATAKDYHVSAYPTMYLIGRKGKIIFIQEGYGKNVEDTLEDIIKKNL